MKRKRQNFGKRLKGIKTEIKKVEHEIVRRKIKGRGKKVPKKRKREKKPQICDL